jgi:hypothetical protein
VINLWYGTDYRSQPNHVNGHDGSGSTTSHGWGQFGTCQWDWDLLVGLGLLIETCCNPLPYSIHAVCRPAPYPFLPMPNLHTPRFFPTSRPLPTSDLLAWPKSRMLVEASRRKLFPQTLPAQLFTACVSGFRFPMLTAQRTAPATLPHYQLDICECNCITKCATLDFGILQ